MMIFNIICLIAWIYWLVYSVFGKSVKALRVALFASSLICIMTYVEAIALNYM